MEPETSVPQFQATLDQYLSELRLEVLGSFAPEPTDDLPSWVQTVLLIGQAEPGFWGHFTSQPEWLDGTPDPMDRWSRRILEDLAVKTDGLALFPFGGAPYRPFYKWALRSGRVWSSPVQLLVHATQGLMVSFRGALAVKQQVNYGPLTNPCTDCARPCVQTCPAHAMSARGYDVPSCHEFLDTPDGNNCLTSGCLVRRACPVSQAYARLPEQSAYHMSRFHRAE